MFFDEIVKSIKANLYERVTSPLAGALIVSWCIWNYPILITLFSSLEPQQKIDFIHTNLKLYSKSFLGPLGTSLLFIFAYPYPSKWAYSFWRKRKKELREAKQKIENEELLSKEECNIIRGQIYELESKYHREMERKDSEIAHLKGLTEGKDSEIEQLKNSLSEKVKEFLQAKDTENRYSEVIKAKEEELNKLIQEKNNILLAVADLKSDHDKAKDLSKSNTFRKGNETIQVSDSILNNFGITPEELELLLSLANKADKIDLYLKNILSKSTNRIRTEHLLDELSKKNFIDSHSDFNQQRFFSISTKGRKLLVESGLF